MATWMSGGFLKDLMSGETVKYFCDEVRCEDYFEISRKVIMGLHFVNEDIELVMDHNFLSMV